MALIKCDFFSESLQLSTSMTVILPQQTNSQIGMKNNVSGEKHQTLYLLHGLSDDHTIWTRRTSIERYAAPLGLAVVMPQVDRSFYTNMAYGNKYWTFLTEELPNVARSFFALSSKREDNFVAGLSMGGYGAFKWALNKPDDFIAAASLSGAMDVETLKDRSEGDLFKLIFGNESILGTEHDLFSLINKVENRQVKPSLYQCCGTEDFLFEDNKRFKQACEQTAIDYTYEFSQGIHEWGYWDRKIQDILEWLPIKRQ